jgi:predicted RNA-binding protein with PUA-like domain
MPQSYWLLKTEPETYSFQQLVKDQSTSWNGVRNFQARNHLKTICSGDIALIYHSGDEKSVVGIAQVIREAYPDPDPKKPGDWVQIGLKPVQSLVQPVKLAEIKLKASLSDMPLIKQSRLSVMPISKLHYETILKMGSPKK